MRERFPRIGGLVLALSSEPAHETMWARGAVGEERVAGVLAQRLDRAAIVLHDRSIPGSRGNIDHIAVAPSGVWVIDSKRYRGKVAIVKPLFGKAKLTIAGRDRTVLVAGLAKQVAHVEGVMSQLAPDVPVRGALCFVDADLPLLGTLTFSGYPLIYPKPLAKRINRDGPLATERVPDLAAALAMRFPAA